MENRFWTKCGINYFKKDPICGNGRFKFLKDLPMPNQIGPDIVDYVNE
jgi:hypothetical protein